jgi:hypothetical protein
MPCDAGGVSSLAERRILIDLFGEFEPPVQQGDDNADKKAEEDLAGDTEHGSASGWRVGDIIRHELLQREGWTDGETLPQLAPGDRITLGSREKQGILVEGMRVRVLAELAETIGEATGWQR